MTARRGVALTPMETRRDVIVRAAVLADRLGYQTFAVPEGWGLDSVPVLTEIALLPGQHQARLRRPCRFGGAPRRCWRMTAATLHQVSGGRDLVSWPGRQHPSAHRGVSRRPVRAPGREAARHRDQGPRPVCGACPPSSHILPRRPPVAPGPACCSRGAHLGRRAWRSRHPGGGRTGRRLGSPRPRPATASPPGAAELSQLRETAAPGAEALSVASGPITAVGEDPDAARDIVATCVALYLSAMGDVYRRSVSGQGYAAEVRAILAANPRPSPRHGVVPGDAEVVLEQLAADGTSDQVRQQVARWDQAAEDPIIYSLPPRPAVVHGLIGGHPAGRGTGYRPGRRARNV